MRSAYPSSSQAASWVAINTHANREAFAIENLQRQGFESYCPRIKKRIGPARREREVLRPLFPGYVFVAYDPDMQRWRPLLSTYGVRRVLSCGQGPSLLDGGFVTTLKSREIAGVVSPRARDFAVGQQIRVTGGPFDGIVTRIIELDENERVVVLLNLLGKPFRAAIEVDAVSAATTTS